MDTQAMTHSQASTGPSTVQATVAAQAQWRLGRGEVLRLHIGPGEREFHVTQGRVWLTREGTERQPSEDLWLDAGDDVVLASGSMWVAEAWAQAQFQLLVPPPSFDRRHGLLSRLGAWTWPRATVGPFSSLVSASVPALPQRRVMN
jgi:hypothetical protein